VAYPGKGYSTEGIQPQAENRKEVVFSNQIGITIKRPCAKERGWRKQ